MSLDPLSNVTNKCSLFIANPSYYFTCHSWLTERCLVATKSKFQSDQTVMIGPYLGCLLLKTVTLAIPLQ